MARTYLVFAPLRFINNFTGVVTEKNRILDKGRIIPEREIFASGRRPSRFVKTHRDQRAQRQAEDETQYNDSRQQNPLPDIHVALIPGQPNGRSAET